MRAKRLDWRQNGIRPARTARLKGGRESGFRYGESRGKIEFHEAELINERMGYMKQSKDVLDGN